MWDYAEVMKASGEQFAGLSPAKRALLERLRRQATSSASGASVIRKRLGGGPAPASFAQQRLWLVHQLDPQSHLFNVPRGIRLRGSLNIAALERALNEIVRRHEVSARSSAAIQASSFNKRSICPRLRCLP